MYLALTDLYCARWSESIHDEWMRNVRTRRSDITQKSLERIRELMDAHVRDALVVGYEPLIEAVELPDPDDRHVVACALRCGAETILTFNLRDFPESALAHYGVRAVHPDEFIVDMLDLDAGKVVKAARSHRAGLRNPPMSPEEYLDCLQRQGLPHAASELREYARLL